MAGYVPESGAKRAEPWGPSLLPEGVDVGYPLSAARILAQRTNLCCPGPSRTVIDRWAEEKSVNARPDPKSALQGLAEENPANAAPRNPPTRRT